MSRLLKDGNVLKLLFAKAIQKKINNCFSDFVERRQRDDDDEKKGIRISGLRKFMLKMFTTSLPNNCIQLTNAQ